MRAIQVTSVLAFAAQAAAHGYIYRITADNAVYESLFLSVSS
jgi:hypothetical protein